MTENKKEEIFDIVDKNDRVLGTAPRRLCHGDPSLVHRTAHVIVFHPDGKRILLQLRTGTKDIQPGKWDTAVGGHLDHGEDYETAARREMSEELGLPPELPLKFLFDSKIRNNVESENIRVYSTVSEGPFLFQKSEIDAVRFFTADELESRRSEFTPNLILELETLKRNSMKKNPEIVAYGEILFDIIKNIPHLGGAPLNLAVHLKRLGAKSIIISAVGTDNFGDVIFDELEKYGMDTAHVLRSAYPTGTVTVSLDAQKVPWYEFLDNCAYDHIRTDYNGSPDLFCYGTLAQRSEESRSTLRKLWDRLDAKFFYDVNLRQNFYSPELIRDSMNRADIVKINDDELKILAGLFQLPEDLSVFAQEFNLETIILTMGPDGCRVYSKGKTVFSPALPVKIVSTVGAGDAFSAAFLYNYLLGRDLQACADAGNALAAKVAGEEGAI